LSTTNNLRGWVDDRRRVLIDLRLTSRQAVCASINTGFNGYLLWESLPDDLADFGEVSTLYEEVEVAGGRSLVVLGTSRICWFDDNRLGRNTVRVDQQTAAPGRPGGPGWNGLAVRNDPCH
jgi:hypothetical protein